MNVPSEPVAPPLQEGERAVVPLGPLARGFYLVAGLLLTAVGIIGVFVPLLPTTVFLILAAWCFSRSSPRLEAYLLHHPRLGPPLQAWRRSGAIPRSAKWLAFAGMAGGYTLFYLAAEPGAALALAVAAFLAGCALFVGTRPSR
ncbi:MAG TPA: YbaN family protein [Tianweitania sediminis]|jgi:hypothetical protein|nr:YbaN family protein [Tianweitania sediminis]